MRSRSTGTTPRASRPRPPTSSAEYRKLAGTAGKVARNDGDAAKGIEGAAKKLEASYEFPFLAHAAMEPMNCVIKLDTDSCEVWNGEQFQTADQAALAQVIGLKPEQIKINMLFAGGSFGRRANSQSDYLVEAAVIAKAILGKGKPGVPVKLVWTREDDMQGGLLSSGLPARVESGARRFRRHHGLAASDRRAVDPGRYRFRESDGEGRHRRDQRRGRVDAALRHREPVGRRSLADRRRAGALVALGRLDAHGVLDRDLHGRARASGRQGSGRVPQDAAGQASAASGRARTRRRRRPAGARRSHPARPGRSAAAASRCTSRSTPSSPRSPK